MTGRVPVPEDRLSRALIAVGVVVLVVGLVVGTIAPAAGVSGDSTSGSAGEPRQVNPAEVRGDSDLSAVERQLAGRLAEQARSGAIDVSSSDVDQARERFNGTEYESLLERYASVADETGSTEQTIAYRRMLEAQINFTTAVEEYTTGYQCYQHLRMGGGAIVGGDDQCRDHSGREGVPDPPEQARIYEQAHELSRLSREVDRAGTVLVERYRTLENRTGEDFSRARVSVRNRAADVSKTQSVVRKQTFDPTDLTVTSRRAEISFADPLTVTGRVTANGSAAGGDVVRLSLGNQTVETTTRSDGTFEVSLHPSVVRTNVSEATVRYVPSTYSATASASRTFDVDITQTTPQVTVTTASGTLRYGDRLRAAGRVSADGVGTSGVPYVVLLDGSVITRNVTGPDGRYNVSAALPSTVSSGPQTVSVFLPLEDQALARTSASSPVTIAELATSLSVDATHVEGQTVRVEGLLSSVAGDAVVNQTVGITAGDTTVGTAETDANGTFTTTVAVPGGQLDGGLFGGTETVSVTASYRDAGSNLAPSRDSTSLTVRTPGQPSLFAGLGVGVVALAGGAVLVWRRPWRRDEPTALGGASGRSGYTGATGRESDGPDAPSLLSTAREALGRDPETTVRAGYAAVRRRVEGELATPSDGRTLWEFYRECQAADLDEETLATLRDVTERYEQVAYAADSVSSETARAMLDEVESFVDDQSRQSEPGD